MRDHPSHNGKGLKVHTRKHFLSKKPFFLFKLGYIMAGLWGAQNSNDRNYLRHLAELMFNSTPRHYWDFDQALLRRIIWPEAVKNSVQHDSYSCHFEKFNSFHPTVPFPTQRRDNLYVGWGHVKGFKNNTGIKPCPKQCRLHSEWRYC